ncbi:MAG TPA: LamG domain-containing protein, partial [Opitutaceae bacterium]|nr:LamG domain-containing protein [Opitutaceae bacterium]
GKFGNALVFNGANALVTIKDSRSLHLSAAMTLEAWVLAPAIRSAWQDVIYKGSDNYFLEGTSNRNAVPGGGATFGTDDAVLFGPKPVTPNVWTHLALTYDGTALRLFVNGAQVSSRAHKGAILTSSNPLQIGGDSIYGQFFAGTIDEVRVYNVALSAAQIRTDMNTPVR